MLNSFVSLAQAASSTSGGFSGSLSYFHFTLFNLCILFSSGMVNKYNDDDDVDWLASYVPCGTDCSGCHYVCRR